MKIYSDDPLVGEIHPFGEIENLLSSPIMGLSMSIFALMVGLWSSIPGGAPWNRVFDHVSQTPFDGCS